LASVKFRSERDALAEMLATASRAVGGRGGSSPVLLGLLLTCTGNSLCVTGTDLDLTIQVTDEVIGIDDGSCVIPARLSTDIVRRLEPGAVTFADDGDDITISAARSNFKLHTYPVVEFPPVGKTSEPTTHLSEAVLSEAVRQVVRAASHDEGRPLLTGVLLSRVDSSLRMVATDSYRMAMRDLAGAATIPGEEDLLVPARALSELQRLPTGTISEGSDTDKVGVAASSNEITFWQGNVQISTRLLEGRYPDYKQLIPDHYPNRLHLGK
jgi:DNA polymerase-3 subunit beta